MQKEVLEKVRKEYLKLKKEKTNQKPEYYQNYKQENENSLINLAYDNVPYPPLEKEFFSNHVMVYMGSYIMDRNNGNNDYITYDGNPKTSYKKYLDLETYKNYDIEIDRCNEFESVFLVLYCTIKSNCEFEYRNAFFTLQKYFKQQIITRSQEDVIDDLKILYGKKEPFQKEKIKINKME